MLDEFIALIIEAVSAITGDMVAIKTPFQFAARIRMAVERILTVYRDNAVLARIVIREGSSLDAKSAEWWQQAIDRLAEIGAAVMEVGINRGPVLSQNTRIVPYCVLGMYERVAYRWLVEDQSSDVSELDEVLTRYEMLGIDGDASPEMEAAITGELHWS